MFGPVTSDHVYVRLHGAQDLYASGYTPAELRGFRPTDLVHPDDVPQVRIVRVWNAPEYKSEETELLQLFAQVLGGSVTGAHGEEVPGGALVSNLNEAPLDPNEASAPILSTPGSTPGTTVAPAVTPVAEAALEPLGRLDVTQQSLVFGAILVGMLFLSGASLGWMGLMAAGGWRRRTSSASVSSSARRAALDEKSSPTTITAPS